MPAKNPDTKASGGTQQVPLSQDLDTIRAAVENAPDVRLEKIAALKRQIASGDYQVPVRKIAEKMINEFLMDEALKG